MIKNALLNHLIKTGLNRQKNKKNSSVAEITEEIKAETEEITERGGIDAAFKN